MEPAVWHEDEDDARRPFVVTPYHADAAGRMVPVLPASCWSSGAGDLPCRVTPHSWRGRTTGPGFPVRVATCPVHGAYFTLYPPGHAPYQRKPLAPVAPDGSPIAGRAEGARGFEGTVFDAALDAADGVAWARECPGGTDRWWGTQCRQVERATMLCGVAPVLEAAGREVIAAILGVDGMLLHEQAGKLAGEPGYRRRGLAVCAVLARLGRGLRVEDVIAGAGRVVGTWGEPYRWDPVAGTLRHRSFRSGGTRAPPPSA